MKEVSDRAGELVIEAQVVLDGKLKEVGKAKGTRGQLIGDIPAGTKLVGGSQSKPPTDTPTLSQLMPDISPSKAKRARLPRGANQHASIEASSQDDAADQLKVSRSSVQRARVVDRFAG